jgi:hypothetical protein
MEGPFPVFDLPAIRTGTLSPGPISGHLSASLRALEADDEATERAGEADRSGRRCCEPLLPGESARSGLSLSELSSRALKCTDVPRLCEPSLLNAPGAGVPLRLPLVW